MTKLTMPAHLPDADRMTRICELLSKAMLLEQARCVVTNRLPSEGVGGDRNAGDATHDRSDDARLEAYVAMKGEATPAQIRATLEWSRKRTYLAVHHLQLAGRIVAVGQTRSLVYRLNPKLAAKAELN